MLTPCAKERKSTVHSNGHVTRLNKYHRQCNVVRRAPALRAPHPAPEKHPPLSTAVGTWHPPEAISKPARCGTAITADASFIAPASVCRGYLPSTIFSRHKLGLIFAGGMFHRARASRSRASVSRVSPSEEARGIGLWRIFGRLSEHCENRELKSQSRQLLLIIARSFAIATGGCTRECVNDCVKGYRMEEGRRVRGHTIDT